MDGVAKSGMQCAEFEALLADALDATLHGATLAAFEAHEKSCSACAAMFQEAAAGMHWLKELEDVEPPKHLVHNILAQTIGSLPEPTKQAVASSEGWVGKLKSRLSPMFAPVMTPRFAMSFGMAFFSLTMLANVAGLRVTDLKHVDLSAKGLQKAYYSTEARVVRYYENIRLVYEIESRVRDLRRAATPEKHEEENNTPKNPNKGESQPQEHKYQNYSRDESQPLLASCPAVVESQTPQARLNRRTA
ncbi:MAG TPA: zf-HC2 domain-containing protein [Candidatus Binatia bacterium]|nr:zf-HC2 domain-containing protein [Candidatus Binatia bacterium]